MAPWGCRATGSNDKLFFLIAIFKATVTFIQIFSNIHNVPKCTLYIVSINARDAAEDVTESTSRNILFCCHYVSQPWMAPLVTFIMLIFWLPHLSCVNGLPVCIKLKPRQGYFSNIYSHISHCHIGKHSLWYLILT